MHHGKRRNVNDDTLPVQSGTINQHHGKHRNVNDDISHDISSPGYNLVLIIELGILVSLSRSCDCFDPFQLLSRRVEKPDHALHT